ncbi:hypothetical protein TorRG33x02_045400 [Trema orientale]|uniref:Uncharacterized protein n=1 Tax=Trema orientale TaxID=63057 RepID=A0A2P5FPP6_TREOI|nr:hypothetical protein TorRG33x02_045400 [Trema orientale]
MDEPGSQCTEHDTVGVLRISHQGLEEKRKTVGNVKLLKALLEEEILTRFTIDIPVKDDVAASSQFSLEGFNSFSKCSVTHDAQIDKKYEVGKVTDEEESKQRQLRDLCQSSYGATFCEMYANFCYHLFGEWPDFSEDNKEVNWGAVKEQKVDQENNARALQTRTAFNVSALLDEISPSSGDSRRCGLKNFTDGTQFSGTKINYAGNLAPQNISVMNPSA